MENPDASHGTTVNPGAHATPSIEDLAVAGSESGRSGVMEALLMRTPAGAGLREADFPDLAPVGYVLLDGESTVLDANQSVCHVLGVEKSSLVGRAFRSFVAPLSQDDFHHHWRGLSGSRQHSICEAHLIRNEGGFFHARLESHVWDGTDQQGTFVHTAIMDAGRERHAGETLILESLPGPAWIMDAAGVFVAANRQLPDLLGTDMTRILGRRDIDVWPPHLADRLLRERLRVLKNGQKLLSEETVVTRGKPRVYEVHWAPVAGKEGVAGGTIGVMYDVTEWKRVEEAARRTQKMESIGLLAGGIAHDFNNLLHALLGNLSIGLRRIADDHPIRENIEKAIQAAEKAANLTGQLLAYSGQGKFEVRPVLIDHLIQENIHLLGMMIPKNVVFRHIPNPARPAVQADPSQLQQLMMNLIINSAEAIGAKKGTIIVRSSLVDIPAGDREYRRHTQRELSGGSYVLVEVKDDGCGMDAETVAHIFDPFFSTKVRGRGLGLAAVLGIVRSHAGGLRVDTEKGKGTTFGVVLPALSSGDIPDTVDSSESTTSISSGKPILVIDDEPMVLDLVQSALELSGLKVISCQSGEAGAAVLRKQAGEIGLVILDLSMPGMSGEETFRTLQEIDPGVPLLLSSGFGEDEVLRRFEGMKSAGFIQKPYKPAKLLSEVQRLLG